MKFILLELGFRSLYILGFYAGLSACAYLSFGLQYEYAQALFNSDYQCADFCYESASWQWYNNETHKAPWLIHNGLCHPSKSWGVLPLAPTVYFNPYHVDLTAFISGLFQGWFVMFLSLQLYGFTVPGLTQHKRVWSLLSFALVFGAVPNGALYAIAIISELWIEPQDSELIFFR